MTGACQLTVAERVWADTPTLVGALGTTPGITVTVELGVDAPCALFATMLMEYVAPSVRPLNVQESGLVAT